MRIAKTPRDENFPVASLILSPERRDAVLAFYAFVRAADDIADAPHRDASGKLETLTRLEHALLSGDSRISVAARLYRVARRHGTGIDEARTMLRAFRQDVMKTRYAGYAELMDYCRLSAQPVGHFLLRLHGEDEEARPCADALCTALQILNHLQDCHQDWKNLGRLYLPVTWLSGLGGAEAFFSPRQAAARRAVLDAMLDRVDDAIDGARALPMYLRDRRLRAQSIATLAMAERLSLRLRRADPVVERIETGAADAVRALARGICGAVLAPVSDDQRITRTRVRRSGSSFRLGMQNLERERRRAIHAVYAFCRSVDDVADAAMPPAEKTYLLNEWRREIDRLSHAPQTPIGRELARGARLFGLPIEECHRLLDGMEADSAARVRITDDTGLTLYARRVAGSVGVLAIHVFGAPEARAFALELGRTLQLVNILRDVDEDAARERVYVPLSRLACLGLQDAPAAMLVADPRFARVCEVLAEEARSGFAAAQAALRGLDCRALKPAILMMEGYRRVLERLIVRGWATRQGRLSLSVTDRLSLIRHMMGSPC